MSTAAYSFPMLRPPFDDWAAAWTGNGGDPDEGTAYATFTVTAADPGEAEQRVLSWVDYHFEDDLRGAVATATPAEAGSGAGPGSFTVRVAFARPRS